MAVVKNYLNMEMSEDCSLLGCDVLWLCKTLLFWRNIRTDVLEEHIASINRVERISEQ
jgi:hypothetical protein